ncbi:N-acetylglucosamine-6-phosphate deacetylase [Pseudorhodoferax sp. Leaf267]|uniref:N-acetylglucosamine-6-phosphate deacetylase n=1 Tax=Pseudorhodoferax sp. Leaf267 TaxID=1736316 RepID=UPI0006F4C02E|nr:N-acetylglucosamine-6-phosphate deacetylase [Pseudorhodoferax sp. Leaf267]KQP13232.1 N-acetylglucosamine-6-phosphate deacetylase [Pseudorhodoferax sp. Leaf267]
MNHRLDGCILTPTGWVRGTLTFGQHIVAIDGDAVHAPRDGDALVLPGFIDLHVHGGGGADVMDGHGAIDTVARTHARYGTTSLLATTMTAPPADLEHALRDVGRAMAERPAGAARVLGVHLEGPFINPGKLGAQPACARDGSFAELATLHALARIRVLTLAPEVAGHLDFIRQLKIAGILPQIGHSSGSYEDGVAALDAGAGGFTHLFNAMSELHHRKPGMVGAALAHAEYAELIPDLLHVHPGAIRAARRAIPKLYGVTDSTAGAGMPDGEYHLGSHTVTKCLGGVRLPDGTLAGSVLTMDQAFRNLASIGIPLHDVARHLSTNAADYLGEHQRGRLQPGAHADIVVMSPALQLTHTVVEGETIELVDA